MIQHAAPSIENLQHQKDAFIFFQTHLNPCKSDDRCESYSHFNKGKSVLMLQKKMEQRANIKFCVKLEKKFTETYSGLYVVYTI